MSIIEKIMSWFGGKVVPLEEAQKQMPNHEPEEKEPTTTDEGYEKIVEKKKPKTANQEQKNNQTHLKQIKIKNLKALQTKTTERRK